MSSKTSNMYLREEETEQLINCSDSECDLIISELENNNSDIYNLTREECTTYSTKNF